MEYSYPDEELEEIESRLYSEAYHSKPEDDPSRNIVLYNKPDNLNEKVRYFEYNCGENRSFNNSNSFIPLESSAQLPIIQNNITVIPPNNIQILPNKVTVNQYTVPFIEILPPLNTSKYFTSWIKTNQYLINQKHTKKYLRKQAAIRKKNRQIKRKKQEIISLLDDSEEECTVMSSNEERLPNNICPHTEDDDIIFIPPPPLEVINLDDESEDAIDNTDEKEEQNDEIANNSRELPNTPESSNDFLENTNLPSSSNNFNFSLHGSDFNNSTQSEFVQPNIPQTGDGCETESSTTCSNDHSTEFNNSVKTIVFNEVEFPKGDIFSEKNLETFGSLITPKRISQLNATAEENDSIELFCDEQLKNISKKCNKPLPNLSPIPLVIQNDLNKITVKRKEEKDKSRKSSSKRIKEQQSENQIIKKTNKKKKKKKYSNETVVGNDTSVSVATEQNISAHSEQDTTVLEVVDSCDQSVSSKRKKKCIGNVISTDSNPLNEKTATKKRKQTSSYDKVVSENLSVDLIEPTAITPQDLGNEFSDVIVIDEINESDSDLEIIEVSNCDTVKLSDADDVQLANCPQNKFLKKYENVSTGTNFDVHVIQNTQSDDPEKWKILDTDRIMLIGSNRGLRCARCRHVGHRAKNCMEKQEPLKCSLCGEINHLEPRCPNKMCRQCGNKGDYSTSYCWRCFKFRNSECHICHMTGHISKTCPDLWRRYHLTTDVGPLVRPEGSLLKPKSQWWCSGCAKRGHLEHECNYYTRVYPPTTPAVISYEDVFNNDSVNNHRERTTIQKDCNKKIETYNDKEIPSLLDVVVPKPRSNLVSVNIDNSYSVYNKRKEPINVEYNVNVTSSEILNTSIPIQPDCTNVTDKMNEGTKTAICLQFEKGIPQPNYQDIQINPSKHKTTLQNEGIVARETDDNQSTTRLQHEVSIPQPIYQHTEENSYQNNTCPELEIVNNKNLSDCTTITKFPTIDFLETSDNIPHVISPENLELRLSTSELETVDNGHLLVSKSKNIIMTMPDVDIKNFLRRELKFVENQISAYNPRHLRDKFYKYDKYWNAKSLCTKVVREKQYWFQVLNMFIFGVHKYRDGNLHVNNLRDYLANSKPCDLNESKRKSLVSSYSYIFGSNKHVNVSYQKILKILIQRYDEGKILKPLL